MIELRHLRYLIAAADHGSLRQAAMVLHVNESALSRRIRDLEDMIGCTLLMRHSGGVQPTDAGEGFLREARRAMLQIGRATAGAGAFGRGEDGLLRIGICFALTSGFSSKLIHAFGHAHPRVHISLVQGGMEDHLPASRSHNLDIALLADVPPIDGCEILPLWEERIYVALAENDILAANEEIAWDDLAHRAFVVSETPPGPQYHDRLIRKLGRFGALPVIERQAVHRDTLMHIVASGRMLKLTSQATTAIHFPGVVYRPVTGETLSFSVIWSAKNGNPPLRRFLSLARSTMPGGPLRTPDRSP